MYKMLRDKNEGLRKEAMDFASRLVQLPSPSLSEQGVAEAVEMEMTKLGYDKVFRDKAGNVVGIINGRETNPAILLCSHMDAVDADKNGSWIDSPYSGAVRDGMIFGRGASDCKGGLAAQVYAGALLKRSLLPLQGTLIVAATVAEENGMSMGTRILMNETLPGLGIKPDFAVLGEPTGLGLYYGHDGWMEMDVSLRGADAFNVNDAAGAVTNEIRDDYMEKSGGEYELSQPEFNGTAGDKQVLIRFKRRLSPSEQADDVVQRIEKRAVTAAKMAGIIAVNAFLRKENQKMYTGRLVQASHMTKAWATDPFDPMLERARESLAAAGCAIRPDKWKLKHIGMGTAGSVLLNEFKVPVIGYGPGTEEAAHAVNEYVEMKSIEEAIYGTAVLAHGIAGIPVCGWTLDEI
jgi:acetylornithine deacetylase/succinyl-diaminopimelate desuccinylase-like protein